MMRSLTLISVCLNLALCTITLNAETNDFPATFASMPQPADSFIDVSVPGAHSSSILYSNLPFTVYFGIDKQGDLPLEKLNIGFFLSEDLTHDAGDLLIGEYTTAGLDTLNTYWFHQVLDSIDLSSLSEGSYYLIVAADHDNILEESNESNNTFITQVVLCKSYVMPENLVLSHLSTTGDTVSSGSIIGIDVSLRSEYLNEQLNVDLHLSKDTLLDESDPKFYSQYISINENQERDFSTDYEPLVNAEEGMPEGWYYIFAIVDRENRVRERVETDNQRYTPLYIKEVATYDIEVENLTVCCDSVLDNQSIQTMVVLKNNGSAHIPQGQFHYYLSTDTAYSPDDIYLSRGFFPTLRPGERKEISSGTSFNLALPLVNYNLLCRVDTVDEYKEYNEINNVKSAPVSILDPSTIDAYDLEILGIHADDTISPGYTAYFGVRYFFHNNERASVNIGAYISKDTVLGLEDLSTRIVSDGFYADPMKVLTKTYSFNLPADQDTGKFYLIFKGDDYNHMAEDDEENNIAIKPVWFYRKTINIANLEMSYLYPEPQMVGMGSMISGRYGIKNFAYPVPAFVLTDFFLSGIGSDTEIYLGTDTTFSPGSDISQKKFSFPVPDAIGPGTYTLRALVRAGDGFEETYLGNNEKTAHIALVESDVDYLLEQLEIKTPVAYPGDQMEVSLALRNNGTTGPSKPFVSYYISEDAVLSADDIHLLTKITPELGIQTTRSLDESLTIPTGLSPGQYYLVAALDAENHCMESDETNNVQSLAIEISKSGSNLVVENPLVDALELVSGNSYSLSFTIRNTGNSYASSSSTGIYLSNDTEYDGSDLYLGGKSTYSLYGGQQRSYSATVTIPKNTVAGTWHLLIVADIYEVVNEVNEDDNARAVPVSVSDPVIDLEIQGTNVTDTLKILQGTRLSLNTTVVNHGQHSYTGSVHIYAYISSDSVFDPFSDIFIGSDEIRAAFAPGASVENNVHCYPPDWVSYDSCWIFLFLDALDAVQETDEDNNVYSIPAQFTEMDADLQFSIFNVSPDTILIGGRLEYEFKIRNQGTTMTNTYTKAEFYLSVDSVFDDQDMHFYYYNINIMNAQEEASRSTYIMLPSQYSSGTYYLIGVIDRAERILESNEENNISIQPFQVVPKNIDLKVSYLGLDVESGLPGQYIRGDYALYNAGKDDETRRFRTAAFISTDTLLDASDIYRYEDYRYGLPDNTSYSSPFGFTVPQVSPGTYYLLVVVDVDNDSDETNETNNTVYTRFYVTSETDGPDYSLEGVVVQQDLEAGRLEVSCSVRNNGTSKGNASTQCKFYLSYDEEPGAGDFLFRSIEIEPLEVDEELEIFVDEIFPEINYNYLIVTVDDTLFIDDQNRSNNIYTYLLQQELPYDLILESSLVLEEVYQGGAVTFTSVIERQGERLYDSVSIAYYISRDSILEFTAEPRILKMIPVPTGQFTRDTFEYVMPETVETGTYYGIVALAWDTIWMELKSGNNFEFLKFEVLEKPYEYIDLVVTTPYAIKDARGGDTIQVTYQLENRGNVTAANISLDYYLSSDLDISDEDTLLLSKTLANLEVGGLEEITQELILPLETEKGDYLVLIHAKGDDQFIEVNEGDNLEAISYRLGDPLGRMLNHQPFHIDLYPNPTSDFLILESVKVLESFRITDMHGRILNEDVFRNNEYRMSVDELRPGMYLLWISTKEESQVLKFIVE